MASLAQKPLLRFILMVIGIGLVLIIFYTLPYTGPPTIVDPVPSAFSGRVQFTRYERGAYEVMIENDPRWFRLDAACNAVNCLSDIITIGDTLSKDSGSVVVHLTKGGRARAWYLDWAKRSSGKRDQPP